MGKIFALVLLATSAALVSCDDPPPPRPVSWADHVRFCAYHHPGYDPRSNLFPDGDGGLHVCRGPRFLPPPPRALY